jgi:hypothetical protein
MQLIEIVDSTDPSKAVPTVEALKIAFIMLGGLGVILPTYLRVPCVPHYNMSPSSGLRK